MVILRILLVSKGVSPILGNISLLVLIEAHPRAVHAPSKGTKLQLLVLPLGNTARGCKLRGGNTCAIFPGDHGILDVILGCQNAKLTTAILRFSWERPGRCEMGPERRSLHQAGMPSPVSFL